jgi:hypothetical protein
MQSAVLAESHKNKPLILNVVMLRVVIISVIMLSVAVP